VKKRIAALDVGQWLAVEEPDDVHDDGVQVTWKRLGRGQDEITASRDGVLVYVEWLRLRELEDVLAAAKRRHEELCRIARDAGMVEGGA
jgi:hypothetical protein